MYTSTTSLRKYVFTVHRSYLNKSTSSLCEPHDEILVSVDDPCPQEAH